jgi:hypothetical protein
MPDIYWNSCRHDPCGENVGVRKDTVSKIANLMEAESNRVFNIGRLGSTDRNKVGESRKSGIGAERF